ncbi:thiaminase II [Luteimonas sp. BDR2-5]|uniref:thiaminase II n=1 Tax=Proluteimonas luteida TaxID=2878685 RepID=UPI001E295390|nr:thiaminase II [Luteimonas sp. BDR2-5]MCD9027804.1 thiaminase II [Luteimonas sp. BDR2-5]
MSLFERLKAAAADDWNGYVDHAFVRGLGDGTLPQAAFRRYLVQDYLFLIQFARAHALAAYKARSLADMRIANAGLAAIVDVEMQLHLRLCERWGLSAADVEAGAEHPATVAYTRWVLDIGMAGDLLELQVALTPCTLGYAEIGRRLAPRGVDAIDAAHPYREWIGEYAGDAFQQLGRDTQAWLDDLGRRHGGDQRFDALLAIFAKAARLEADFWQMGLDAGGA